MVLPPYSKVVPTYPTAAKTSTQTHHASPTRSIHVQTTTSRVQTGSSSRKYISLTSSFQEATQSSSYIPSPKASVTKSVSSFHTPVLSTALSSTISVQPNPNTSSQYIVSRTTNTELNSFATLQSSVSPTASLGTSSPSSVSPMITSSSASPTLSKSPVISSLPLQSHSVSSEISQLKSNTISKSTTHVLVSSISVGWNSSEVGSGQGSGLGSGSGMFEDPVVEQEDYLTEKLQRQKRSVEIAENKKNNVALHKRKAESYNILKGEDSAGFSGYSADSCHHTCRNTPGSFVCGCYKGFVLNRNRRTCDDVNECAVNNGGCSHQCINMVGSYRCHCPHSSLYLGSDGKTCKAHGMTLVCTKDYMQVNFEKKLLKGLDKEHVRLADPLCLAFENDTHIMLKTELDKCGTEFVEQEGTETYKNKVINRAITIGNLITRVREIEVPFECIYDRNAHVTGVGFRPDRHKLTFSEDGFGKFTFQLSYYHGASYRMAYTHNEFPVKVELRDRLYFEVKVQAEDANLVLFLDKCFGSPSAKQGVGPRYVFLDGGCPKDDTLQYKYSLSNVQRFNIEAFRFLESFPNVYIHCDILACHKSNPKSRCSRGCQSTPNRVARDIKQGETRMYSLLEGPISKRQRRTIADNIEGSKKDSRTQLPFQYTYFLAGIACTALIVGGAYFIKGSRARKGYQRIATHDRLE